MVYCFYLRKRILLNVVGEKNYLLIVSKDKQAIQSNCKVLKIRSAYMYKYLILFNYFFTLKFFSKHD